MPNINIDDAYILDNTGKQVDDAVDYGLFNSNKNLLDNAYFVGGGSQLGDGVFPINQRGQTQYAWSGATCIDRWLIFSANDTVTLSASGLTLNANDDGGVLGQRIKYYPEYSEQPLICTFLTTDNKRIVWSFTINTSIAWQGGTLVLNECPDFYLDALYDSSSNTVAFVLAKYFDNIPHSITLKAAKLEIGTVSTLANDVPPDFGEELRKCQRYLWVHKFPANTIIGSGLTFNNNTIYDIVTPVAMRTGGTLTMTASTSLYVVYNATYALAGVVNGITSHGNHLRVSMNNNGGSDYGTLNHADLLVSYETVVTVANEL